jgi:hypothetical protein
MQRTTGALLPLSQGALLSFYWINNVLNNLEDISLLLKKKFTTTALNTVLLSVYTQMT